MSPPSTVQTELTIVVPCFNERPNVLPLITRLNAALAGIAWEAIFVDDNSPDGTAAVAKHLTQADPRVRCIRRVGRRGLASACVEGMLASAAPYVAVIDGDLQHDETILPQMLQAVRDRGADIAIGSRHITGGAVGEGLSKGRARISDLGGWLASWFLHVRVSDPMSGYFLLRRDMLDRLAPRLSGHGFKILLDILLCAPLCTPGGVQVQEVPYVFRPRLAGESKLDVVVLLEFALLLTDRWSGGLLPRRFVAFAGVGTIGVGLHLAVMVVVLWFGHLSFNSAQWAGTLAAMLANFHLNNTLTYRDARLRGHAAWRGMALFLLVCGVGAVCNVGIANLLMRSDGEPVFAGAAGAVMTAVWNYAMSSTLVWRRRR